MTRVFENRPEGATTPTGWPSIPLKYLFRRSKNLGTGEERLLSIYRDYGVIPKDSRDDNFNKPSDDLSKYQVVSQGDLVVNKMKAWQGSVAISEYDGIISPAYFVYRPMGVIDGRFAHYLLRSNEYFQYYASISSGVRPNQWDLDPRAFERLEVTIPSHEEQHAIADYLDRETAEIDAFLADLENLKTLTTERVLALLEHELWGNADEVAPLRRFLLGVDQGISPEADSSPAGPGEVGVLKAGCTNNGRFDVWANKRLDSSDQFTASMFVAEGDLIVTRASGSLKHVGSAALVPCLDRTLAMSDKHYRLIPDHRLNGEYLALVMQTNRWRTQLEPLVSGAHGLARNISVANLKTLKIPVVSRAKQEETKANLREQIQKVGMASEDVDALISLGEERRAALISAAVTGQIDLTAQGVSAAEQLRDELEVYV